MDKEADTVSAFGQVGFGFVEVGTLTPRPQPGNDKPRLFRLIPQRAIINRMGFNNHGIAAGVENIREATRFNGVLGVNIGKNKVTPNEDAAQDYLACLRAAWPVADYIAINFSSPNTPGLRDLQAAEPAARLLASLKSEQANMAAETGRQVPIFMKVAPDVTDEQITELSRVFLDEGLDGLIATNTTLSRTGAENSPRREEAGGPLRCTPHGTFHGSNRGLCLGIERPHPDHRRRRHHERGGCRRQNQGRRQSGPTVYGLHLPGPQPDPGMCGSHEGGMPRKLLNPSPCTDPDSWRTPSYTSTTTRNTPFLDGAVHHQRTSLRNAPAWECPPSPSRITATSLEPLSWSWRPTASTNPRKPGTRNTRKAHGNSP